MKILPIVIILLITKIGLACQAQQIMKDSNPKVVNQKEVHKNGMVVRWHYQGNRILIEMSAPTNGWVTVGFNDQDRIKGAYLLMGRVLNKQAEVVEHYTIAPGNYHHIEALGVKPAVQQVFSEQKDGKTTLKFSLPIEAASKYQKSLKAGQSYIMILAYSSDTDFQHHSRMRTSLKVTL